ncbi:hypothetical protein BCR35DRAFT_334086 [Leucosporidium creatinivorum]|uniref:Uncharacterized protein n=1 Tax=Leucosporidium creatinivorum TaxID=106004 RepID=A0A1Y2EKX0_9BASI|nr:hypothetical protein BCR35DRAFT_334086 [Leucosporidium creatinivorum]
MARITSLDAVEEEEDWLDYKPPLSAPLPVAPRRQPPRSLSIDAHLTNQALRRKSSFQPLSVRSSPFLSPLPGPPRRLEPTRRPASFSHPSRPHAPVLQRRSSTMVDLNAPSTFDTTGHKDRPFSGRRGDQKEERMVTGVGEWFGKAAKERKVRGQRPTTTRIMDFEDLAVKHKRRLSEIQQAATTELELEAAKKRFELQKQREAKEQQALLAARAKQGRRRFFGRIASMLTCGLASSSPFKDKRKGTPSPSKMSSNHPYLPHHASAASEPPSPRSSSPDVSPAPSISSVRLRHETKRLSGISRVEEWKGKSAPSLLQPPPAPRFRGGLVSRTRSAPELAEKSTGGGGKHHWLDY